MSAGGIGIQIMLAVERPIWARRTFQWPPRITRRNVHAGFEGLPGRIGVYQGDTRVGTRGVFVFVVFGRAVPSRCQLNRANVELQRARLA
jgi:hypothetical protein